MKNIRLNKNKHILHRERTLERDKKENDDTPKNLEYVHPIPLQISFFKKNIGHHIIFLSLSQNKKRFKVHFK